MIDNPLSNANYREMNAALTSLQKARLALEQAKKAGVDVTQQEGMIDWYEKQINQRKATYFRNKP